MNVNNVTLEAVTARKEQYPTKGFPEIAFVGKSNVGKSSLINGLINRKKLARTSQNPGKTQTINFYNVEEKLYFVDLPGYGYAKISKAERERWGKMIEDYLHQREYLKLVVLLVDIRHEPSNNDQLMADWIIQMGYKPLIIATKADKIKRSQLNKHVAIIRKALQLEKDIKIVPFSAMTKQGKEHIWQEINLNISHAING